MTTAEKIETKQKIVEAARMLFSRHGFSGTSIRQIAEESDVNVAAINYHFGSKENLYWGVISDVCNWMDEQMIGLTQSSEGIEDFALNLFRFMREHQEYAVATMKTFLSDHVPAPDENMGYIQRLKEEQGPPGARHIVGFLQKQNPEATPEAIQWMVTSLFSSVFHFATITCCPHYTQFKCKHMPIEKIEDNIVRMAEALNLYMGDRKHWD